jgi:hypothetical protein
MISRDWCVWKQQKPLYLGNGRISHKYVLHFLFFISTIPSVLQVAQQVAFLSLGSPERRLFLTADTFSY